MHGPEHRPEDSDSPVVSPVDRITLVNEWLRVNERRVRENLDPYIGADKVTMMTRAMLYTVLLNGFGDSGSYLGIGKPALLMDCEPPNGVDLRPSGTEFQDSYVLESEKHKTLRDFFLRKIQMETPKECMPLEVVENLSSANYLLVSRRELLEALDLVQEASRIINSNWALQTTPAFADFIMNAFAKEYLVTGTIKECPRRDYSISVEDGEFRFGNSSATFSREYDLVESVYIGNCGLEVARLTRQFADMPSVQFTLNVPSEFNAGVLSELYQFLGLENVHISNAPLGRDLTNIAPHDVLLVVNLLSENLLAIPELYSSLSLGSCLSASICISSIVPSSEVSQIRDEIITRGARTLLRPELFAQYELRGFNGSPNHHSLLRNLEGHHLLDGFNVDFGPASSSLAVLFQRGKAVFN